MRVICSIFQVTALPEGKVRLDIENPEMECEGSPVPIIHDPILHRNDVAKLLGVHVCTIDRLSVRPRNPFPWNRSLGKPYILASKLREYLAADPTAAINARFR